MEFFLFALVRNTAFNVDELVTSKFLITLVDPLTPRAFYQKMHFFGNLDFSTLDMSQISYLLRKAFAKLHRACLSTYIVFMTLGMHRNQNFEFLDEKVTYISGLFVFFNLDCLCSFSFNFFSYRD